MAFYLNKYLGKYCYGLDPQSLKISVFKGDVELRNLQLKPEALADLNLPITVKSGLLGKLTLKVRPAHVLPSVSAADLLTTACGLLTLIGLSGPLHFAGQPLPLLAGICIYATGL